MNTTGNTNYSNYLKQFAVKCTSNKSSENKRTVIYNRCSSEKQDTLEQQDAECVNLCREFDFEIIKTYLVKESAETDDRKVFKEMLAFCEQENIGHIVVHNYDRFTRSGDVGLLKQLREKGIRVHSVRQRVDDETSSGQFSQSLFVLFAKWENDQRRDRIILGQRNKLRRGEWIGHPTTGYEKRYVTGKKEHILDKPQCFINDDGIKLRQAFHWKDRENLNYTEIIDRLKKMGLHLTPQRLSQIFRNPFYAGYITNTLLDDGEIVRGKHEPLVSEELFLRVNGILNKNSHGWKMNRENEEMPLKASVRCGTCNRPLTAYSLRSKYVYYKCPDTGCCVNIRNLKLHDLFTAELSKLSIKTSLIPVIISHLEATHVMLHASDTAREKPMKDELTRLKNELETMEFNLATSKITPELFQKHSASHRKKITEIEVSLKSLAPNGSNLEIMLEKATKLASNLLNMWQISDYNGKVRLQNLVFPDGLQYIHENHTLRTLKINPIISAITYISTDYNCVENAPDFQNDEKSRQLYLMFRSSNFFWGCLEEIHSQVIDFETNYTSSWPGIQFKCQNWSTDDTVNFNNECVNTTAMSVFKTLSKEFYHAEEMTGGTACRVCK
ncbi:MAG TPA: recombinase family protein [Bacteroidia bacterium]|nr:recombinase family protein [Bacteroidia bacterium]